MTRYVKLMLILILGLGLGFWVGRYKEEYWLKLDSTSVSERKPLYYRHPMNPQVTSATPTKDEMGIAPVQLQRLQSVEKPLDTLPLLSPVNGVVLEKPAVEGMRFMPGELLFRIVDLSTVWLLVDVFEQDIDGVHLGQSVQVHINAYPERLFSGKVGFIYPTLAAETRTVKVRVELPNGEGLLKPGLYASVTLTEMDGKDARLAVPDSAVIDSGIRQIVLLSRGNGRFEPRAVKLGLQADGYRQVLEGLEAGNEIVTRANFLIDAESNLKSALDGFGNNGTDAVQTKPQVQHGDY